MNSSISRRQFLKRSGVVTASAALSAPTLGITQAAHTYQPLNEHVGRAFQRTPIHSAPDDSASISGFMLPDVPTAIVASEARWYRVAEGYVRRASVQPILPYQTPAIEQYTGMFMQVISTSTLVREYCSVLAPIKARLGWGAVLPITDRLIVDDLGDTWYGVGALEGGSLVGWTPALHWAKVEIQPAVAQADHLYIDPVSGVIEAFSGKRVLARLPIRIVGKVRQGETIVKAAALNSLDPHLGTPFVLLLEDGSLIHGAYWHNDFARPSTAVGAESMLDVGRIELPVYAAQALFPLVSPGTSVMVRQ